MGSNCGIVSSNLPPIKAFCPDSVSWAKPGNLHSLVDAMTYYIENLDAYNNHRNINNRLIRDTYNWEKISGDLLHIYKELLN